MFIVIYHSFWNSSYAAHNGGGGAARVAYLTKLVLLLILRCTVRSKADLRDMDGQLVHLHSDYRTVIY
jgi:hypothetical protein